MKHFQIGIAETVLWRISTDPRELLQSNRGVEFAINVVNPTIPAFAFQSINRD